MEEVARRDESRKSASRIEVVAAVTLGVLAVSCFVAQGLTIGSQTTKLETALFNLLQFVLTMGFSWFSSRAVSRADFEKSLKRFAISAYRRVADIEQMMARLQRELRRMSTTELPSKSSDMLLLEAVVLDCTQVVRSSTFDWSDVIGDELLAVERLRRLQRERDVLTSEVPQDKEAQTEVAEAKQKLEHQIAQIRASLPPSLRFQQETTARSSQAALFAATWIAREHERDNGLILTVVTGDIYPKDRERRTLSKGETLLAHKTEDGSINVLDSHGRHLGRLQNTTPLTYNEFANAFTICYGDRPVPIRFLDDLGEKDQGGGKFEWFRVQVAVEPAIDTNFAKNLQRLDPCKEAGSN
jgi:hypothetical protein